MSLALPTYSASRARPGEFLVDPYLLFDSRDGVGNARGVPEHFSQPALSSNVYTYSTGDIRFAACTATLTKFYALGPGGAMTAARLLYANTTRSASFHANNLGAPAAGTHVIRFKVKSNAGAGSQNIRYGSPSSPTEFLSATVTEGAWSTLTFAYTTTGSNYKAITLQGDGTNTPDLLIDEIQFYQDAVPGDLPAFSDEPTGGDLRRTYAYANSLAYSGNIIDNTGNEAGAVIRVPGFPTPKVFTEITMLVAFKYVTGVNNTTLLGTDTAADLGTTTTTAGIRTFGTLGLTTSPLAPDTGLDLLQLVGEGWHIIGLRAKNGARSSLFHEIEMGADSGAFSGLSARAFRVLQTGTSENLTLAGAATNFPGQGAIFGIWDSYLAGDQLVNAVAALRARVTAAGETMAPFLNYYIAEGDSITDNAAGAPNGPGYVYQLTDAAEFNPNLFFTNMAVSGSTLAGAEGRLASVTAKIAQARRNGRRVIVSLLIAANDSTLIQTDPAAYYARLVAYWAAIRAAGAKMVAITALPKNVVGFEAARLTLNGLIRGDASKYDALADFGADPDIGAAGAPAAGVYYYDDTHLNAAGHAIAKGIIKPAVQAVML